jgi:hypothetical protein
VVTVQALAAVGIAAIALLAGTAIGEALWRFNRKRTRRLH